MPPPELPLFRLITIRPWPLVITYQEIAYYPPGPVLIDEKNDGPRLGLRGEHVDNGIELRLLGRSLDLEMNRFKGVSGIV